MGKYKAQRKLFTIQFEKPELEGLEVKARSVSLGKILGMMTLAQRAKSQDLDEEGVAKLQGLFDLFTSSLVSWNLQHEEDPEVFVDTPLSTEGLLEHEADFALDLVLAWLDAVVAVPRPLGSRSNDGSNSLEESMPMAAV